MRQEKPLLYPGYENASHQILLPMNRPLGVDAHHWFVISMPLPLYFMILLEVLAHSSGDWLLTGLLDDL